jgi:hypothetical protein
MTMAWQIIEPLNGGNRGRGGGEYAVRIALNKIGSGKPGNRFAITFGAAFMKAMRWQIGDKMMMQYDAADGLIGVSRSPNGKFLMSSTGNKKNAIGKIVIHERSIPIGNSIIDLPATFQADQVIVQDDIAVICCKR